MTPTNGNGGNLLVTVPTENAPDERITVNILECETSPVKTN
jgi:hypothetical protein